MTEVIKVSDIVNLKETTITKITESIERLSKLSERYRKTSDVHSLEDLKKEFNGELQYFAELYAKTKTFKGTNHVYLEDTLKNIKARTIDLLLAEGVKITNAEGLYRVQPYFIEREKVAMRLRSFFIKVELMYEQFNGTLQCIVQSISVASKEMQNSKMV